MEFQMPSHTFAVLLQVTTNDPRLTEEKLASALESTSPGAFAAIRHAVLSRLPKDVERLIAVLPIEHMRALMLLHEAVGDTLGADPFVRPPPGYVPPTRD
jgi:hypothetical protein